MPFNALRILHYTQQLFLIVNFILINQRTLEIQLQEFLSFKKTVLKDEKSRKELSSRMGLYTTKKFKHLIDFLFVYFSYVFIFFKII